MTRPTVMNDEWADRQRRAARLEPDLVGLTMAEATALVAGHDGLSVRFSADDVWTADLRPGRIDALVRDGVVVDRQTFDALPRVELSGDAIVLHDLIGPVTWPDLASLARDYWAWQRMPDKTEADDLLFCAYKCVREASQRWSPEWRALALVLIDVARGEIEQGRSDARFRQTMRSVYLDDGVPRKVVAKLRPLVEGPLS